MRRLQASRYIALNDERSRTAIRTTTTAHTNLNRSGVPLRKRLLPVRDRFAINEVTLDFISAWMMRRELDAKLSHASPTSSLAVQLHREFEVALKRSPLLYKRRRKRGFTAHERARLSENPRISDTPPRHRNTVDARVLVHAEDVVDRPDVAGSKDQAIGIARNEIT